MAIANSTENLVFSRIIRSFLPSSLPLFYVDVGNYCSKSAAIGE
jgi:hypothetical protein